MDTTICDRRNHKNPVAIPPWGHDELYYLHGVNFNSTNLVSNISNERRPSIWPSKHLVPMQLRLR
jgi:hypothetical protein